MPCGGVRELRCAELFCLIKVRKSIWRIMNTILSKQPADPPAESQRSATMSNSADSPAKTTSTNESESSSGFRTFWRKSDKTTQAQNVTFVQQDPSNKKSTKLPTQYSALLKASLTIRIEGNRISRLLKSGSNTSSPDDGEPTNATTAQKRRHQVYQAQKYVITFRHITPWACSDL